jgi:hypothetical protein
VGNYDGFDMIDYDWGVFASVLGIEECDNTVTEVAQKVVKLLLSVETVSLVERGVVVAYVLEDLLVEVVAKRRDHEDDSAY